MLEIEKRAQIKPEELQPLLARLGLLFGNYQHTQLLTILLSGKNVHGRLRKTKSSNIVTFTSKSGGNGDVVREEINQDFSTEELDSIKHLIQSEHSTQAFMFTTDNYRYQFEQVTIDVSDHSKFGCFLEAEILLDVSHKSQETAAISKIDHVFEKLGLTPINSEDYHRHYQQALNKYSINSNKLDWGSVISF